LATHARCLHCVIRFWLVKALSFGLSKADGFAAISVSLSHVFRRISSKS